MVNLMVAIGPSICSCDAGVAGDSGHDETRPPVDARALAGVRIPFVENRGQLDPKVLFYAATFAGTVFVTDEGLTYAFHDSSHPEGPGPAGVVVRERFLTPGAFHPRALDRSPTVVNYFVGERESWRSGVPAYGAVDLGDVWPSIRVELQAHGNNVEKVFTVQPEGRVSDIRVEVDGATAIGVDDAGRLQLETELGDVAMTPPTAFQDIDGLRRVVEADYWVEGLTYGFTAAADPRYPLVIDPLLASTFLGGNNGDRGFGIALGLGGTVFVVGQTQSIDFPVNAFDTSFNGGGEDAFVSKFDAGLGSLLASTYLGGSGSDLAAAVAMGPGGTVYVTGQTQSANFPVNGFDTSYNGLGDAFVSKFDAGLGSLLASTYLGGSGSDVARAVAVGPSGGGTVFVTGFTQSTDFPATAGSIDATLNGVYDGFVSKFGSGLGSLMASTYLGGNAFDQAFGVALGLGGTVFVTGFTQSSDFPATGYDTSLSGPVDAFVSKLDSGLGTVLASTYLGGSGIDIARGIANGLGGTVFVTGFTQSADFPATGYDTSFNGVADAFVSKFDGGLGSLLGSTYLGGSDNELPFAIALGPGGTVYVTGQTQSFDFPAGGFDTSYNGLVDAFVSKLDAGLGSLLASTYLGGTAFDTTLAIAVGPGGTALVTGSTQSADFPWTVGVFDTSFNSGGDDAFVTILDANL